MDINEDKIRTTRDNDLQFNLKFNTMAQKYCENPNYF